MSGAWAAVERRCWLRVGPRSVRAPSADPHQPLPVRDLLLSLSSPADRAAADDSDRTRCRRRQALEVSPALRARVGRARDQARRSPPGRAPGNARSSCTGSLVGSVPGSCSIDHVDRLTAPACAARACSVCVCVGVWYTSYTAVTPAQRMQRTPTQSVLSPLNQRRAVGALLKPYTARRARRERRQSSSCRGCLSHSLYLHVVLFCLRVILLLPSDTQKPTTTRRTRAAWAVLRTTPGATHLTVSYLAPGAATHLQIPRGLARRRRC